MYIFPDMIDLGLQENQVFPTEAHRQVAQRLALSNPNVKTKDALTAIVQEVLTVSNDRIRNVTLRDLPICSSYQS